MEHWHYKHIEYRECEPCDSNRLVSALQHEESFEVTREKEHDGKVNEDAERKLHPGVGTFFGLVLGHGGHCDKEYALWVGAPPWAAPTKDLQLSEAVLSPSARAPSPSHLLNWGL